MNETQAMPSPGTYFATNNGNGSIADGLALASLRDGSLDEVTSNGVCDLRMQVSDVKSDIRESIQNMRIAQLAESLSLHNRLCESEKAAIEAKFEAKLEVKDALREITEKVDGEAERTNDKVAAFEKDVEHHFCDLERRLDKQFCDIKERELLSEVSILKTKLAEAQSSNQQTILAQILAAVSVGGQGNGNS